MKIHSIPQIDSVPFVSVTLYLSINCIQVILHTIIFKFSHWKVFVCIATSSPFVCLGRENRDLDILIFKEVLDYMAQVDRVLTMPGGSLLMAGRSGVGRRTAVTLVSHMHQMHMFTPKISRGYGLKHFKNDLKTVRVISVIAVNLKLIIL